MTSISTNSVFSLTFSVELLLDILRLEQEKLGYPFLKYVHSLYSQFYELVSACMLKLQMQMPPALPQIITWTEYYYPQLKQTINHKTSLKTLFSRGCQESIQFKRRLMSEDYWLNQWMVQWTKAGTQWTFSRICPHFRCVMHFIMVGVEIKSLKKH